MIILQAEKNRLTMIQREQITSGSVNVYRARFEFSPDWDGLTRTAVFKAGAVSRSVLLDDTNECVIPWEVLEKYHPFTNLMAGVYGTKGGEIVLPTVWARLGQILEGVTTSENARPPTPELWRQELDQKQDKLHGLPGQVVGFDETGRAVPVDTTGGGAGYDIGHGLAVEGGKLTVVTTDDFKGDNTLPMTAAGVENVVGNIEILLKAIRGG